jgi:hypothetical protein
VLHLREVGVMVMGSWCVYVKYEGPVLHLCEVGVVAAGPGASGLAMRLREVWVALAGW